MDRSEPAPRLRLRTAQIGERWVIRRRLADGSAADVIGWLERIGDDEIQLSRQPGTTERIPFGVVLAARRAPAAAGGPDRLRMSAADLEHIALPGWLAWHETLGDWTLRAAGGFTGPRQSCLAVGDPGMAFAAAAPASSSTRPSTRSRPGRRWSPGPPRSGNSAASAGNRPTSRSRCWGPARRFPGPDACRSRPCRLSEQLEGSWQRGYAESRPNEADPELLRMILDGQPPRAFASARRHWRTGSSPSRAAT